MPRSQWVPGKGCRQHGQRDRDDQRDDQREHGDLEGDRKSLQDRVGHRDASDRRHAEVAVQRIPQPVEVLDDERPVEPELAVERRHILRRRFFSEHDLGDRSGGEAHEQTRQEGDEQDDEGGVPHALEDVIHHCSPPPAGCGRSNRPGQWRIVFRTERTSTPSSFSAAWAGLGRREESPPQITPLRTVFFNGTPVASCGDFSMMPCAPRFCQQEGGDRNDNDGSPQATPGRRLVPC